MNTNYLTTKTLFRVTVIVATLTVLGIWLFGMGENRSIYNNSILSTTILSICFFLFLTIGLYNGIKLKDNLGRITDKLNASKMPNFGNLFNGIEIFVVGDSIGGMILSIILWLITSILIVLLLWLFGVILWTSIVVFVAMLYWIFFRALRLLFKNSNKCRNNLGKSISYGIFYTALYNSWIYAIIFLTSYINNL